MIFTDRTIIVQKGTGSINDTIILYRGDKGVEIRFTLNEGSPFRFGSGASPNIIEKTEAAYGQLIIKRPNDLPAVFSEIAPTNEGKIVFTITAEMIDEITEVGNYTFQIRLLDESRNSRATLPEVVNGIEIREPIATEDITDTNEVGIAAVGYALTTAGVSEDAFDAEGNYNKTTWGTGDRITASKLNKIEAGIEGVNQKVASGGTGGEGMTPEQASQLSTAYQHSQAIHAPTNAEANVQADWNEADTTSDAYIQNKPTNISEFANDANYASETYVTNKIAEASLSGGEVDLSGYVTKETGNANQITFADGQTFQAKLDAGILKGDKGDQGLQGIQGEKGDKGEPGSTEANAITIADTANNFTANTVEGALAELFQYASNGKNLIAQAITGKGVNATSNDTWQELATKISQILGSTVKINSLRKLSDCKFKLISSTSNTSYNSTEETAKNYNDDSWDNISIPHDWSIYNSFNSNSPSGYEGGYLDGGDAWYRFKLKTAKLEDQKLYIYFDGIYMESDVYINGTKVKSNKWYNPFYVEITDYLQYDNNDTLAVFVRNQQPSSRWYSGSGIIRNAYLVSANDVEIGINDINITTPTLETDVKTNVANTKIDIKINSTTAKTVNLVNEIYLNNSLVKSNTTEVTLSTGSNSVTDNIQINNPTLWDEYNGNLYTLKTYIKEGGAIYHSSETKYGYRYFKFDKDTGFWLNGRNLKLRGVCMHHDLGCLGAEVNKSAIERQINLLIDMGVNAIRITHNPGSLEFLNICAEKGILTIEEMFDCWTSAKKQYDFARYYNTYAKEVIDNTINRDKNNPSIIMWSIGNEIIRTSSSYDSATATGFVQNMINWIKAIDNERMVTMGDDTPTNSVSQDCMRLLDVVGVNYGSTSEYSSLRAAIPNKPIYGSETTSSLSSRGVYSRDDAKKQCSSFDNDKVGWGEYASIELKKHMNDIDYLAGMFVWTGFDYIGEPTPFNTYPCKSSYFGIYDTCGFPKDIMYMYQSRWTSNPMIHILPHWDWKSSNIKVWLYSNCYKVELFLNGTSLGEKLQTNIGNKYQFEYSIAYAKGTLVANGYNESGNVIAQDIIYTSQGTPTTTKLSTDKTSVNINSDDLIFITCDLVDKNGVIVPTANNKVTFTAEGGTIIGTDNGDATCVERYRSNVRSAFNGKVLCVVKHDGVSGNITIKASGDNLTEQTIIVTKGERTVLAGNAEQTFIDAANPTIYDYITVTRYTVTNNLTNCTTSNSSTIINENSSYTATITANDGYTLSNVTVTMGGADISSTAVQDGVITINAATGDIVITASATAESSSEDTTLVYSMASPTTFNGTSDYIDTGVQLFDTNKDFAIFLDFTSSETQNDLTDSDVNPRAILHCINERSPWPGIDVAIHSHGYRSQANGYNANRGVVNNSTKCGIYTNSLSLGLSYKNTDNNKIIIIKNATDNKVTVYDKQGKVGEITGNTVTATFKQNVLLGAYQSTSGTKGRFWIGTINQCKIWLRTLTDDEITNMIK